MKKRWLLNLGLFLLVAGLVAFLYLKPQNQAAKKGLHEVSTLKLGDFQKISVEFPTQAPTQLSKIDGAWRMTAPYQARADLQSVNSILSVIAAKSAEKFAANDLAKYGLDSPLVKLKLTNSTGTHEFLFGTHNPVTEEQYVSFENNVYLLPVNYAEAATTQATELIDKSPLSAAELKQFVGFNFSFLEQWQALGGLEVSLENGNWKASLPKAKPAQNEMNEWFEGWKHGLATSVETYKPDRNAKLIGFDVKLANGKKVHFERVQESPELLLGRPDEGLLYHFASDIGFVMLNPPINATK